MHRRVPDHAPTEVKSMYLLGNLIVDFTTPITEANAIFIAAARQLVPEMRDRIAELEVEVARLNWERPTAAQMEEALSRAEAAEAKQAQAATTSAARDVLAERVRQISTEGWTPDHDDALDTGELSRAAAYYIMQAVLDTIETPGLVDATKHMVRELWPFARRWWKPTARRRDLVKAAALTLAEIERLDRAAIREGKDGQ